MTRDADSGTPDHIHGATAGQRFLSVYPASGYLATPSVGVANAACTLNQAEYTPVYVPAQHTFTSISVNLRTAGGSTGAVARLGVYADNGSYQPGLLLLDAGTVATDVGVPVTQSIVINFPLAAGVYWLCHVPQVAASATYRKANGGLADWTDISGDQLVGFHKTGVTGALASSPTTLFTDTSLAQVIIG